MECNCNNNNSNGGVIPWVRGNRLPLIICVYENVVTQEQVGDSTLTVNEMTRVPYTIQDNDTVTVIMKSGFRQVEMPFTTDGNKVMVTDNGELPTGAYTVEVTIERGDGARGRWQETRQVRIYENTSDAQLGEMYSIDADLFFYAKGDTGTGIADITNNPDGTLTITMTDGTSYVTEALKGDKGDKGDTGERGVSIVAFDVTGQTDVSVIYTVTFSDDTTQDISVPKGPQGDTGLTGNGISSTTLNSDYTLTISYTDGTTYTTPSIRGAQGAQGVSVIGFTQTGETATNTMYNLVFSDGRTQSVAIPKGLKGDKGDTGNTGSQGAQGPKGDTVTATDYTLYNAQGGSSEGAMSQDATTKAISAQTGYYTCGTAAGTAEKVVTVESGNLYKRTLGGHFKVKMTNANTAASGVTLQIGSETAAALWYNGVAVSASNTWDAGEVLSVYYDGTYYQASNAQGDGGKEQLNQLRQEVDGTPTWSWRAIDLSSVERQNIFINGVNGRWDTAAGWYTKFLPVLSGKKYRITAGTDVTRVCFMTTDEFTLGEVVDTYAAGWSDTVRLVAGETSDEYYAPSNAEYMYILTEIGNGDTGVSVSEYYEEREGGLMERTAALESDNETIMSDLYGSEGWEEINLSAIARVGYFINGGSGRWDGATGWYCKFVPVIPNKMYRVTAGTDVTRFTFLTTDEFTPGTVCDTYASGWSETVRVETGETSDVYYAPYDARYMYLLTEIGNGDTGASVEYSAGDGLVERVNSLEELCEGNILPKVIVNEGVESTNGVFATLQGAVDAITGSGEIVIEGDLHIDSTVLIPADKTVKLTGGGLKGTMQSLGVRRKDTNGVAKVYIGDLKPQWIEVDGVAKYPASSLRDYPYKAAVTSSGSSNTTVTVTITVPVADAVKLAAKSTTDVWITLLVEWMAAKLRIDSINTSTGVITCTFNQGVGSYHNWSGTNRIIVENIDIESATINGNEDTWTEGTFYYSGGYLYYKYNASESAPNIEIPAVETLISANGSLYMDGVEVSATAHDFDNLMGEGDGHGYRSFQSGLVMNGAIEVNGQAEIRNCKFRYTTNNAIRVNSNANGVNIVNCDFNEVGCDAILVGECNYINYNKGTAQSYVPSSAPSNVTIKGNSIHHPGRIYQEASAIAVAYGTYFYVGSNVISDTYYTGISTGADWAATSTQINVGGIIEGNLCKNIGVGSCALSDGAAIYNLGNERGMVVTKNIITSIFGGKKGGQNLYAVFFDQGSKNITFSNNIVYDVYGFTSINTSGSRSGISVKNNIFAMPKSVVADQNENLSSCFANNIFAWSGSKTVSQTTTGTYVKNLYYRYDSALSSINFDTQAVIGNPGFRDVENYDFAVVDTTKTSQAEFTPFLLNAPAASLVSRTDNIPEDAAYLSEWITAWENGTL